MSTSPSIRWASSNCVSAAVVPFSALSILIALNVPNADSLEGFRRLFSDGWILNGSGCLRNRTPHRRLDDRQVDQCRQNAEQDRQPPDRSVRAVLLEHDAAEQHAEKTPDLMAEKRKTKKCRQPPRAEHQRH